MCSYTTACICQMVSTIFYPVPISTRFQKMVKDFIKSKCKKQLTIIYFFLWLNINFCSILQQKHKITLLINNFVNIFVELKSTKKKLIQRIPFIIINIVQITYRVQWQKTILWNILNLFAKTCYSRNRTPCIIQFALLKWIIKYLFINTIKHLKNLSNGGLANILCCHRKTS